MFQLILLCWAHLRAFTKDAIHNVNGIFMSAGHGNSKNVEVKSVLIKIYEF